MFRIVFKVFSNVVSPENIKAIVAVHNFETTKTVVTCDVKEKVCCAFTLHQVVEKDCQTLRLVHSRWQKS